MSLTVGRRCQIDTELAFKEKLCSSKTAHKVAVLSQTTSLLPELILTLIHVRQDCEEVLHSDVY